MILVQAQNITKSYGARTLFDSISLSIESGERIGLIGPNGAGKSTLLKILAGLDTPDSGLITRAPGLKVGILAQDPELDSEKTVFETLQDADPDATQSVYETLSRLELDAGEKIGNLSGGWKKRVALGCELVRQPTLLFLDEPTNHLDVETIEFLEKFLRNTRMTLLTITHDRRFLDQVANRILELDFRNPKGILSVNGNYAQFVETKTTLLEQMQSSSERMTNTLRRETEWLRRGAKARTTKQQARINRAHELKDNLQLLNQKLRQKELNLDFKDTDRKSKVWIELKNVEHEYDGKKLIRGLNLKITPKTRLALLGPNGAGKSTLIRLVSGQESPKGGAIQRIPDLKIAYFEQNKESLDRDETLMKALCPSGDQVIFQGRPLHIRSYLERFLFDPAQGDLEIRRLSGGEKSRVLIARLMLQPADILILDEPTNDLDLPTLSLLEESLQNFPGAVIFVSHDREFTENVAEEYLVPHPESREWLHFESMDQIHQFRRDLNNVAKAQESASVVSSQTSPSGPPSETKKTKKLSYKDQRELETMEERVLKAESELEELQKQLNAPENQTNSKKLAEIAHAAGQKQTEIDRMYQRWSELSDS